MWYQVQAEITVFPFKRLRVCLSAYLSIYYLSEFGRGYEWLPKYVICHQGDTVEVCLSAKTLVCLDHV